MSTIEPEKPEPETYRTVQIEAELIESVDERVESPEAADEWIAEAVEQYLSEGADPKPSLSRGEYRRWVMNEAIRKRLGTTQRPDTGPSTED